MRRWVVAFVVLFLLSLPLLASCDEEDINTVAKDGEIIVLTDGSAWESDDPGTSSTWLSADTVLVCNDAVMINKDEDGERVGVTRTSYDPDANDDDDDDDEPHVLTVKDAANKTSRCATVYSVILQDTLGNIQQGISKPKNVKWATKDLEKKYPDVCYAPPGPSVKTVFFLTATPATYHGTRIVRHTETHDTPINGQV
ncbi:MAG TPA: hypothetical protein VFU27_11500, partial [Terriglobales bacterium]|nr:hypothetical protein [Terriglobales bacterium]